jgi:Cu+-exporting ATPase
MEILRFNKKGLKIPNLVIRVRIRVMVFNNKSEHKTEINIKGMTCMSCVRNIENNICRIEGVNHISVSLKNEKANVLYDSIKISPTLTSHTNNRNHTFLFRTSGPGRTSFCQTVKFKFNRRLPWKRGINISGMTCNSCVKNIEGNISKNPGVESIKVSLANQNGVIEYFKNRATPKMLCEAIEDMGFDASLAGN